MKKLLLFAFPVLLAGCNSEMTIPEHFNKAGSICSEQGGVRNISLSEVDDRVKPTKISGWVWCNDGSRTIYVDVPIKK